MLDTPMPYLLQYNIGSGSVRPFAGIPMFTHLYDLVLVPAGDQVLMGGNEVLLALDLTSGRTRVVSANTVNGGVGAGPSLEYLWHVAIDPAEGRVITSGFGAFNEVRIGAIDIATGDRRIVADTNTGSGVSLGFPQGLVVDSGRDRALVCDGDSLVGVNLTNGNRTIVSRREGDMVGDASDGAPAVGFGPRFLEPRDVVIDDARDVAYCICGPALRGLLAVDILTGDRLLVSR